MRYFPIVFVRVQVCDKWLSVFFLIKQNITLLIYKRHINHPSSINMHKWLGGAAVLVLAHQVCVDASIMVCSWLNYVLCVSELCCDALDLGVIGLAVRVANRRW